MHLLLFKHRKTMNKEKEYVHTHSQTHMYAHTRINAYKDDRYPLKA